MTDRMLYGRDLWAEIARLSSECAHGARRCAVSYVTDANHLPLGAGDLLIVNAGANALIQGATSKAALMQYVLAGVRVCNLPELHSKVYIFGGTAVVASANISSRAAQGISIEAGIVTSAKRLVRQAIDFIDDVSDGLVGMTAVEVTHLPDRRTSANSRTPLGPEIVDDIERLRVFWVDDVPPSDEERRLATSARRAHRGRGNAVVHTDEDDGIQVGEVGLQVWRFEDDKVFGPPVRVLGRHTDGRHHVLVVRPMDGYELLVRGEHDRRRAKLPAPVRSMSPGSDILTYSGPEMDALLDLFRSSPD